MCLRWVTLCDTLSLTLSFFLDQGDVVELRVGDTIPADIRLVECMNFETDEALLTVSHTAFLGDTRD